MTPIKKGIYYGIFGLSAAVFVVAAVMIVLYFTESKQQQVYTQVQQIYHQEVLPQEAVPQYGDSSLPCPPASTPRSTGGW